MVVRTSQFGGLVREVVVENKGSFWDEMVERQED